MNLTMSLKTPKRGSLHEQVADIIRRQLLPNFEPGQRLEAAETLAQKLSVSTGTVTRALFALAKEGLVIQRHGSGTYVCEPEEHRYIAVLCGEDCLHPRLNTFALRLTLELATDLAQGDFAVRTLFNLSRPNEKMHPFPSTEFDRDLERGAVAGIVAVEMGDVPPLQERARAAGVPLVGAGWGYDYNILTDYTAMVRDGTERLLKAGRRNIAFIGWGATPHDNHPVHDEMEKTFTRLLQAYGAQTRDRWVCRNLPANWTGSGVDAFRGIWSAYPEKPDGLLILDDVMSLEVADVIAQQHVKVPEQLMVVAHANKGLQARYPFPVARLEVDTEEIVKELGGMFRTLLAGQTPANPHLLIRARWSKSTSELGVETPIPVHSYRRPNSIRIPIA